MAISNQAVTIQKITVTKADFSTIMIAAINAQLGLGLTGANTTLVEVNEEFDTNGNFTGYIFQFQMA